MTHRLRSKKATSKLLVLLGASYASLAHGQTTATPADVSTAEVEGTEIVVTANKREQRITDVGLTITAYSGNTLKTQQIDSLAEIAQIVPGLSYTPSQTATPVYTLRGVGFYESSLANYPTTSVYVDQVPLPFPVLTTHAAYDLERVEVLKGPQGTLFGQNSTGGAINFIPAKPTATFATGGDISYSRFNRIDANGYVSGPIAEGLRGRLSFNAAHADDWQKSYLRNDELGEVEYYAGRLLLDWTPSDRLTLNLNVNAWQDKSDPQAPQFFGLQSQAPATLPPLIAAQPFTPHDARLAEWTPGANRPRANNRFAQAALRFDWEFADDIIFTGISSYIHYKHFQVVDQDGTELRDSDVAEDSGTIKSFSQELRIANAESSSLRWVLGANYERSTVNEYARYDFPDESTSALFGFTGDQNTSDQKLRNYALFGNAEYDISPGLTIKAGARYTKAKRRAVQCTFDNGDGTFARAIDTVVQLIHLGIIPVPGFTPSGVVPPSVGSGCTALDNLTNDGTPATYLPGVYKRSLNEDNLSWRVGLDYKVTPDLLLYANISRGYKAGSMPISSAATFENYIEVKQESLLAYEAGYKFTSDGGRFRLNGAAFYYDYKDKQIRGAIVDPVFGNLQALDNIPKSRIYGAEAEVSFIPLDGLTLGGSATYINSKITEYVNFSASNQVTDFAGSRIPFTPKWSGSFTADYRWRVGSISPFIGASLSARSGTIANIGGDRGYVPPPGAVRQEVPLGRTFDIDGYLLVDLRAGIAGENDQWRVTVFGKNVFDKYYILNTYKDFDTVNRLTGMPATYGVTVSFNFR